MRVEWDNEECTIIRLEVNPIWTIDDYLYGVQEVNALMDTVDYKVHVIIDMRKSTAIPSGFLSAMRSQKNRTHHNMGVTVIVGAGALITTMFTMINKILYPKNTGTNFMTSTLESARELLNERIKVI